MALFPRRWPRRDVRAAARIAVQLAGAALLTAVLLFAVAVFVVPRVAGGASLTVLTGSMEPSLMPGDVVVTQGVAVDEVCQQVGIGDIVTYLPEPDDPSLITHRVVGKTIGTYDDDTACRLVTQGDNNSSADEPVSPRQVRGRFLYGVPDLGWAREWVNGHRGAVLLGLLLVIGAVALWDQSRPRRTRLVVPGAGPARHQDADERDLRRRELAVRERDIAVREAELALRLGGDPPTPLYRKDTTP